MKCESKCQKQVQVEKSTKFSNVEETEFITVILSRGEYSSAGFQINKNKKSAFE